MRLPERACPAADLPDMTLKRLVEIRGLPQAGVTVGEADTRELSSQSTEASKAPGLHFIGEVVDVAGWLGGYHFQWAWASAVACAQML